jgi:hypothetical protein
MNLALWIADLLRVVLNFWPAASASGGKTVRASGARTV